MRHRRHSASQPRGTTGGDLPNRTGYGRRTSSANDAASSITSTYIISASGNAEVASPSSAPAYCASIAPKRHLREAGDAGGGAGRLRPHADRAGRSRRAAAGRCRTR